MTTKATTKKKTTPKTTPVTRSETAIARRETVNEIEQRVTQLVGDGRLVLPKNYSVQNAMMAAWLKIQEVRNKDGQMALDHCTKASVSNALLSMVVQGLNPALSHCHFVMFGKTLVCMRDYRGTIAVLQRVYGKETEVRCQAIYEDDDFEYDVVGARKRVTKHVQKLSNVDVKKVVGAYAVIYMKDREQWTEIMTMDQIMKAWQMGAAGGKSDAHVDFTDEMAKKTVLNRAAKILIAQADDSYLAEVVQRNDLAMTEAEVDAEAGEEANRDLITFADDDVVDAESEPVDESAGDETDRVAEKDANRDHVAEGDGPGF